MNVNELNMAKWIAALRSGKYQQTFSELKSADGGFCCLGVLCDISGVGRWTEQREYNTGRETSWALLPTEVAVWAFGEPYPSPRLNANASCTHANDKLTFSLFRIADDLEATYLSGRKAEEILEGLANAV